MEPGPIPPHERTWRHPSELGPRAHVDDPIGRPNHTLGLVVASGTFVVALIAVLVVVTTSRATDETTTLSATTMPAFVTSPAANSPVALTSDAHDDKRLPTPDLLLASLVVIPNEVAAAPRFVTDAPPRLAADLPAADERVTVQTDEMTYHCPWGILSMLEIPDGALVVDGDGALVAEIDGGELIELAGFSAD